MKIEGRGIYNLWAPIYDLTRQPFAWLARTVHGALDQVLGGLPGASRVLDLGAGTGFILRRLDKLSRVPSLYVAIDPSPRMLARLAKLAKDRKPQTVRLVCAEAQVSLKALELHGERFDLVVSSLLLAHLETPEATVARAMRLLRPGGVACFVFFTRGGIPILRWVVRIFLECLGGRPVDAQAVVRAMERDEDGSRRGRVKERRSLGGCLVLLSIEVPRRALPLKLPRSPGRRLWGRNFSAQIGSSTNMSLDGERDGFDAT